MAESSERRNPVRLYRDAFDLRADVLFRELKQRGYDYSLVEVLRELRKRKDMELAFAALAGRDRKKSTRAAGGAVGKTRVETRTSAQAISASVRRAGHQADRNWLVSLMRWIGTFLKHK